MDGHDHVFDDRTPGVEEHEPTASILSYTAELGLAILATIGSFVVSQTNLLWPRAYRPGWSCSPLLRSACTSSSFCIWGAGPITRTTSWPSPFGVLIVFLVITGSIWIIANLDANMMP